MAPRCWTILPIFIPFAGCPHRCLFCDQKQITGADPVPAGEEYRQIIRSMLESAGKKQGSRVELAFYGGSFTALPYHRQKALLEQVTPHLESGEVHGIRLSTRPDAVNTEKLAFLARYGVTTIELGVQSMDDRVLALSQRGHTAEDSRLAARMVKTHGFTLGLQMMTGLPGDNPSSSIRTALELADLSPDMVRIYPTVVIEGTPLADLWRRGEFMPWDVGKTLEVVSIILPLFSSRAIRVSRIGLLLSRGMIEQSNVLAGAYHPSLGWESKALMVRRRLHEWFQKYAGQTVRIRANPKEISLFIGERRQTLAGIREMTGQPNINMVADDHVPAGWFAVDERDDFS